MAAIPRPFTILGQGQGGTYLFADGTAAAPSISFLSRTTQGFYKFGTNNIGVAFDGTNYGLIGYNTGSAFVYFGGPAGSGAINFLNTGAVQIVSGGTAQNITLLPSTTGRVQLGTTASAGVPTPLVLSTGGTFRNGGAFSDSLKIRSYDDGGSISGIGADSTGMVVGTNYAAPIVFYTNAVAAFTLDTSQRTVLAGAYVGSTSTRSGPGACGVTTETTKVTTTGALDALTLADGIDGQIKRVIHDVDGGSFVLTPTTKTGFTTFTSTAVGESISLQFVTTRGWIVVGSFGGVIA